MQFWDSSALVPLVVAHREFSAPCRTRLHERTPRAIAFLTGIECRSAVERLARDGALTRSGRALALRSLEALLGEFDRVLFSAVVEGLALSAVSRHALRSLDALQLACALSLARASRAPVELVCCDRRLGRAAGSEGLALAFPELARD